MRFLENLLFLELLHTGRWTNIANMQIFIGNAPRDNKYFCGCIICCTSKCCIVIYVIIVLAWKVCIFTIFCYHQYLQWIFFLINFCCIKIVLCMINPYFTFENVYTIICSTFHPCFKLLFWLSPMHLVNAVISDWHTCDVVYHQKASYSFFTTIPVATMYLLTPTPEGAYC